MPIRHGILDLYRWWRKEQIARTHTAKNFEYEESIESYWKILRNPHILRLSLALSTILLDGKGR
jgi:hypothetical protein